MKLNGTLATDFVPPKQSAYRGCLVSAWRYNYKYIQASGGGSKKVGWANVKRSREEEGKVELGEGEVKEKKEGKKVCGREIGLRGSLNLGSAGCLFQKVRLGRRAKAQRNVEGKRDTEREREL